MCSEEGDTNIVGVLIISTLFSVRRPQHMGQDSSLSEFFHSYALFRSNSRGLEADGGAVRVHSYYACAARLENEPNLVLGGSLRRRRG